MILTDNICNLICELEYYIGKNCYNHKSYSGKGSYFRYPVRSIENEEGTNYMVFYFERYGSDFVKSLKYKMGANELYIGKGLIDILECLEKWYNIDFDKLIEDRKNSRGSI